MSVRARPSSRRLVMRGGILQGYVCDEEAFKEKWSMVEGLFWWCILLDIPRERRDCATQQSSLLCSTVI